MNKHKGTYVLPEYIPSGTEPIAISEDKLDGYKTLYKYREDWTDKRRYCALHCKIINAKCGKQCDGYVPKNDVKGMCLYLKAYIKPTGYKMERISVLRAHIKMTREEQDGHTGTI